MPNQDYISRPPAKKKAPKKGGSRKGNAKATQQNSLKVKVIVVITLLLIAGFSYGLWALKTAPSTKTPLTSEAIKDQEVKEQKATEKAAKLPEPPKEKWSYVKGLEEKEIEVGQYEVKEDGPYKMQCGSFRTMKQADVLKANIAFAGLESTIQQVKGKNGTWYKVFLGPYPRKRLAEKDKHNLKRNNINDCQIWLWR